MKKYTTEEINEQLDAAIRNGNLHSAFELEAFKNWLIEIGQRKEDKPLNAWYKSEMGSIFRFNEDGTYYGFACTRKWIVGNQVSLTYKLRDSHWQPCPTEEWQAMLIKVAKSKEYKNGNYKCLHIPSMTEETKDKYLIKDGDVWRGVDGCSNQVFDGSTGKWAEIIEQPKEYTLEQVKEAAKKELGEDFIIKIK